MSLETTLVLMGCEPTKGDFPLRKIRPGQKEHAAANAQRLIDHGILGINTLHWAPDPPIVQTAIAFLNGYVESQRSSGAMITDGPILDIAWKLCGTELDEEWPNELEKKLKAAAQQQPDAGEHAAEARVLFSRPEFTPHIKRRGQEALAYFTRMVEANRGRTVMLIGARLLSGLNLLLGEHGAVHRTEDWAFQTGEMRVIAIDEANQVTQVDRIFRPGHEPEAT